MEYGIGLKPEPRSFLSRMRENLPWAIFGFSAAFLLTACAGASSGNRTDRNRLEVLTDFTLALSKRDFGSASSMMATRDRMRVADEKGGVLPQYKERLCAMRLTTLVNNPMIRIEHGKILGIYDLLPVLVQAQAHVAEKDSAQATTAESEAGPSEEEIRHDQAQEELRKASEDFFRLVQAGKWKKAIGLLNEGEKDGFLRSDGRLKEGTRRRLAAVDTSSWEALALENGKLSGIVLIIPANPPAVQ